MDFLVPPAFTRGILRFTPTGHFTIDGHPVPWHGRPSKTSLELTG